MLSLIIILSINSSHPCISVNDVISVSQFCVITDSFCVINSQDSVITDSSSVIISQHCVITDSLSVINGLY